MAEVASPYLPPRSETHALNEGEEYAETKLIGTAGRLGRLRYLAYNVAAYLVLVTVVQLIKMAVGIDASTVVAILGVIAYLIFTVMTLVRRCHDMDWSGGLAVLGFIPLVNLLFVFKAGDSGSNRFGPPQPPNTTGVKLLAFIFPLLFVIGIVAAIALPAYQDYSKRAHAMASH